MVVQRRQAQRTAFVWAVSLDGAPVELRVSDAYSGKVRLDKSQAVRVRASSRSRTWFLLANPQRKKVTVSLPVDSRFETDEAFSVY
jgi:hypothetical protein